MDIDEIYGELDALFNPEPDEDRGPSTGDFPHPRLGKKYGLDLYYLEAFIWEGSTIHQNTRLCPMDENRIKPLIRNLDVPSRLFEAGLRLFGDSILAYHEQSERKGRLRYYPAIILTFWSAFETFVRYSSELMLITVPSVPLEVSNFLRDEETFVNPKGEIVKGIRYHSLLDRYVVLLRYGSNYQVDRGSMYWQNLEQARKLRNYYTHLDVNDPKSISSEQIIEFMEKILIGIIYPSAEMKRTQLLGIYRIYWMWDTLRKLSEPFTEQPFFKDWALHGPYTIYCPFDNVDKERFPNSQEQMENLKIKKG